jgi:hypothetical protein
MSKITRRAILRGTPAAIVAAATISLPAIASATAPTGNDAHLFDLLRQLKVAEKADRIAEEAANEAEWAARKEFPPKPAILTRFDCLRDDLEKNYEGAELAAKYAAFDAHEAACRPVLEAHGWPALNEREEAAAAAIDTIYVRIVATPAASPAGMLAKLQFLMEITVMIETARSWPTTAEAYDPEAAQEGDQLNDLLVMSLRADAKRLAGASPAGGAA